MNNDQLKMSERFPYPWLLKMSIYNVMIGDDTVITRVADCVDVMSHGISELRTELKYTSTNHNIVGIDVVNNGDLLLFYVKKRCLIVQLKRMISSDSQYIPNSLVQFLQDASITFVGTRNIHKSLLYYNSKKFEFKTVVDVGYFSAKILKEPKLLTGTLEELIVEAGVDIKKPFTNNREMRPCWQSSSVLSDEEVKYAMYEAHSCYKIAVALLDMIGASSPGTNAAFKHRIYLHS